MATKFITPRKNNFQVSGLIVKNDAIINNAGTVAHFRIAACSNNASTPSCFFDCVQFAKEGRPIDTSILRKGAKVMIEGYFHMNTGRPAADGTAVQPKMELVIVSIEENRPVEVPEDMNLYDDLPEDL